MYEKKQKIGCKCYKNWNKYRSLYEGYCLGTVNFFVVKSLICKTTIIFLDHDITFAIKKLQKTADGRLSGRKWNVRGRIRARTAKDVIIPVDPNEILIVFCKRTQ